MDSWIWIQSVLRKWCLPGYTVLIPQGWKLDLAWQWALGNLRQPLKQHVGNVTQKA